MRTSIAILELFNEKAEKLGSSRYTAYVLNNPVGFKGSDEDGFQSLQAMVPDGEAVDAFVLTMRFFVQDNEPTSIRNMEQLYSGLPVSERLVRQAKEARAALNAELDKPSLISVNGWTPTAREIFQVFFWGELAHSNDSYKKQHDEWRKSPVGYPMMQAMFHDTLMVLLDCVFWFRDHNTLALRELAGQTKGNDA